MIDFWQSRTIIRYPSTGVPPPFPGFQPPPGLPPPLPPGGLPPPPVDVPPPQFVVPQPTIASEMSTATAVSTNQSNEAQPAISLNLSKKAPESSPKKKQLKGGLTLVFSPEKEGVEEECMEEKRASLDRYIKMLGKVKAWTEYPWLSEVRRMNRIYFILLQTIAPATTIWVGVFIEWSISMASRMKASTFVVGYACMIDWRCSRDEIAISGRKQGQSSWAMPKGHFYWSK